MTCEEKYHGLLLMSRLLINVFDDHSIRNDYLHSEQKSAVENLRYEIKKLLGEDNAQI